MSNLKALVEYHDAALASAKQLRDALKARTRRELEAAQRLAAERLTPETWAAALDAHLRSVNAPICAQDLVREVEVAIHRALNAPGIAPGVAELFRSEADRLDAELDNRKLPAPSADPLALADWKSSGRSMANRARQLRELAAGLEAQMPQIGVRSVTVNLLRSLLIPAD